MKNNTLKEIAEILCDVESILLFTHANVDGDSLGSSVALCRALRKKGKNAWVLPDGNIPANLRFLDDGCCTWDKSVIENPDVCICVDCGDPNRFPQNTQKFYTGKKTMCIDHHQSTKFSCQYNYVMPDEAATGQIIFDLIKELNVEGDVSIGDALFASITTDTGNFQYSNTSKKSHLIAAELMDWGVDYNKVSVEIYENVRMQKILIENRAMSTLKIIGNGMGAILYITQSMLDETGATMDESEDLVQTLRSIAGVEFSAVIKENEPEKARVSLRAKRRGNVAKIAESLGGGGHIKAAGCTLNMPIEEAVSTVEEKLLLAIKELE